MTDRPVRDWLREHLERSAGLAEPLPRSWAEARADARTCPQFTRLRRARLLLGAYRYEQGGDNKAYHAVESARDRLNQYLTDPNRELLVDVANLVELEWCSPRVPGAYWRDTHRGSDGDPGGVRE
jgi:hypothetical protein